MKEKERSERNGKTNTMCDWPRMSDWGNSIWKKQCPSSYVVSNVNWCPQNCITSFLQMIDWTGKRRKKMKEAIKKVCTLWQHYKNCNCCFLPFKCPSCTSKSQWHKRQEALAACGLVVAWSLVVLRVILLHAIQVSVSLFDLGFSPGGLNLHWRVCSDCLVTHTHFLKELCPVSQVTGFTCERASSEKAKERESHERMEKILWNVHHLTPKARAREADQAKDRKKTRKARESKKGKVSYT